MFRSSNRPTVELSINTQGVMTAIQGDVVQWLVRGAVIQIPAQAMRAKRLYLKFPSVRPVDLEEMQLESSSTGSMQINTEARLLRASRSIAGNYTELIVAFTGVCRISSDDGSARKSRRQHDQINDSGH